MDRLSVVTFSFQASREATFVPWALLLQPRQLLCLTQVTINRGFRARKGVSQYICVSMVDKASNVLLLSLKIQSVHVL
jgi:hypothetical protein